MPRMRNAFVAAALAALVAACAWQAPRPPAPDGQAPANFPEQHYLQAAARGDPVFRVDPASSLVVIEVRRGGSLARLAHDHVVASHDVRGYVAPGEGRADIYVALAALVVDEPGLRAEAKFDTQPTDDDIAGTRRNMLNALQAADHPFALVRITRADANAADTRLNVAITLHGATHTLQVSAQIDAGIDEIGASGRLALRQTDFGITPLSVLGGAIQVQDEVSLRFTIRARRIEGGSAGNFRTGRG
jgi:hypothetical protein